MKLPAPLLMLCFAALSATAQPVYRCGSVYTQTPCPQGKLVDATDSRTGAQRAEAQRVAADERRLAAQMQRDRLAEQAALGPAGAVSLSGSPAPAVERGPSKKEKRPVVKRAATTVVIAVDPSRRKSAK